MKRLEKETLKAGLVDYARAQVRNQTYVLREMRWQMHRIRAEKPVVWGVLTDWEGFHGLVKSQITVVRRARLLLEAAATWHELRTYPLLIAAPIGNDAPLEDSTPVTWVNGTDDEPKETTWGALDRNARKTVELVDGHYVGGFPF